MSNQQISSSYSYVPLVKIEIVIEKELLDEFHNWKSNEQIFDFKTLSSGPLSLSFPLVSFTHLHIIALYYPEDAEKIKNWLEQHSMNSI